ncbi:hypothetical protein FB451DRAFT_1441709 [Mycena latifolia]|nr:hypothetical protein FB451DRAFT_1441709 [Mycena latifolia]
MSRRAIKFCDVEKGIGLLTSQLTSDLPQVFGQVHAAARPRRASASSPPVTTSPPATSPSPPQPASLSFLPAVGPRFVQPALSTCGVGARGDALERTWREGLWRDATLAEAALIIALYESSVHPEYHRDPFAFLARHARAHHRGCCLMRAPPAGGAAARPRHGGLERVAVGRTRGARGRGATAMLGRADGAWQCESRRITSCSSQTRCMPPSAVDDRAGTRRTRSGRCSAGACSLRTSAGRREAWHETQAIQDALAVHGCNLQTAVAYLCRENVSNAQMIITKMLRSLQGLSPGNLPGPLFNRRQAEEWIQYQNEVIQRVTLSIQCLSDPRGRSARLRNDTSLGAAQCATFLVPRECDPALHKRLAAHSRSAASSRRARMAGMRDPVARTGRDLRLFPSLSFSSTLFCLRTCLPSPLLRSGVTPDKRDPDTQNAEEKGEKEEIETGMEHEVGRRGRHNTLR